MTESHDSDIRLIGEHLATPLCVLHLEDPRDAASLRLVYANRAAGEAWRAPVAELVGLSLLEAFPQLAGSDLPSFYRDVVRNRRAATLDALHCGGDAKVPRGIVSLVAFPVRDDQVGIVFERVGNGTSSGRRLHGLAAIVDSSSDAIISKTLGGAITSWNRAAEALYGYTQEEVVGRSVDLIVPVERRDELEQIYEALARGERPSEFETVRLRKDGVRISLRLTVSPIHDEHGEMVGASAIARDVTPELHAAEEKLRRSEDLYRLVVENSRDLLSLVDRDGRYLFVSSAYKRILGYEPAALVGTSARELIHPDDRPAATRWFEEPADSPVALRLRHADGSFVTVETIAGFVSAEGAEPIGILSVTRDVTGRIRTAELEERLRHGEKLEAIGQLAGGLAHDFNNLLTVISGFESIALEHRRDPDRVEEALGHIRRAADDAALLTRQLLAFGRQQVLRPEVLDLNQVISGYEPMLGGLLGDDVEVHVDLAPTLGSIKADKGQIGQIVVNLAVNARDAMPGGGKVTIRTTDVDLAADAVDPDITPGAFVRLIVTDTGTGIEPDRMQHLFEPFFTTKDKGSGLGLATVFGIVKQSGGQISVSCEPGQGSSFVVDLPRVDEKPDLPQ